VHPFDEGFAAYESGALITDNPYLPNTQQHKDWERGYQAAYEIPF